MRMSGSCIRLDPDPNLMRLHGIYVYAPPSCILIYRELSDYNPSSPIDRTVEAAGRFLALPLPHHQDLESGKSILVFTIKVSCQLIRDSVTRFSTPYLFCLKHYLGLL